MRYMKTSFATLLLVCLPLIAVSRSFAQRTQQPSGAEVVKMARARTEPLGFNALKVYEEIKSNPFEENVKVSNQWIRGHIDYYDGKATPQYRAYVKDMIDGGGDVTLGMRGWLSDPKNVSWWDSTIRGLVGEDGYARVVALNAAFPAGSEEYRLVYGGSRRFDSKTNTMSLNGTPQKVSAAISIRPNETHEALFERMTRLGDAVRQQVFSFYAAYAKGKTTPAQVGKFNESFIRAGGCAMSNTEARELARSIRYINALNQMTQTLNSLGFRVQG